MKNVIIIIDEAHNVNNLQENIIYIIDEAQISTNILGRCN